MSTFLLNSMIGEYQLVDFLGAGGMGEVYRGIHAKIGRVAAIKVLTVAARREQGFVERFFNEARIQASLQHPNIATLYDFLVYEGQPCIIMEYVDGETLCDLVRPVGPQHPSEALRIFAAVSEAIAYVHSHGIIHRDIKSNNIKIGSGGQVKLLDFGIAKGDMSPGLTETGSVVGTIEYMSPELLATGHASPRSDIWALGVLLYEMTTGRVPFEAQTIGSLCDKISRADYTSPKIVNPVVPSDAAAIIARCLRKNPAERYQSAAQLLQDVRAVQADLSSGPKPKPKPKPRRAKPAPHAATGPYSPSQSVDSGSWMSRNWGKVAGGVMAAMLFLALGVYGLVRLIDPAGESVNGNTFGENKAAVRMKTVRIEMRDGPAEIWRDGKMLGVKEATITEPIGQWVTLTLKRGGREHVQKIQITENKHTWSLMMNMDK